MRPTDVLLFNTHFFHSNTELETIDPNDGNWSRLSCVFYFRTMLGRPSCLAEYRRRLGINTHAAITAEHLDKLMEQTHPAEVTNKLAPVHPVPFTPFVCAAYACSFRGAATSKLLQLHRLSCENVALQEELFGEPLAVSDGLLPRKPEELTISLDSASLPVTFAGGFNVSESSIKFFQKRRQCFDKKNLKKKFTKELVEMWDQCLKLWLILVKEDWNRQNGRLPGRKRFTWNNTSLMSSAFFDLCDVASQMVDDMLVDEGDMNDEQNFWGIFAAFLDDACVKKIGMPPHAMGMQKLNVKLKDYTFGGTRYLKDLPPEDQMRRLLRRQKIEDARRYGTKLSSAQSSEWLHNDTFDYQSEDAPVEYKKNGWIEPEENSRQFRSFVLEQLTDVCKDTDSTDVLVVLPRPAASKKPVSTIPQSQEADRLMKNPAAQRLLLFKKDATSERVRNKTPHVESHGRVRIVTIYSDDDVGESVYDFVIMRHVLASVGVCDAVRSLKQWTSRARYCTFVVEVDVLDRRTYVLRKAVRDEYNRVASDCLKELYSAANCRSAIDLLTTPIIISSIKESGNVFESRFKFSGSPLNTVAFVVRRPEPKLAGDEHEIPLEPEALHV
uniref:Uncharacterized protein TCIL3000_11_13960 n=1 Tax=Trypanosoma congolense (strain IL3000) TaxID=1068625 RepID=G0V2L8_TRYCI|nr:unnamed protein product [Trypanosoma congolense IL3000]